MKTPVTTACLLQIDFVPGIYIDLCLLTTDYLVLAIVRNTDEGKTNCLADTLATRESATIINPFRI